MGTTERHLGAGLLHRYDREKMFAKDIFQIAMKNFEGDNRSYGPAMTRVPNHVSPQANWELLVILLHS